VDEFGCRILARRVPQVPASGTWVLGRVPPSQVGHPPARIHHAELTNQIYSPAVVCLDSAARILCRFIE